MVTAAKKPAKPAAKAAPKVKAKVAASFLAKRSAQSLAAKPSAASPLGNRYAPMPKKKTANRFASDPESVLRYAIKAGIVTPDKKLTPSFG